MKVVIIGGGIIGLCSAYYLNKGGHEVTIIEKTNGDNNCSFGNAGYISPSHFLPLASPGLVKQALKWMFDGSSPFYMQPRFDVDFFKWCIQFLKNANKTTLFKNAVHLNEILQYSRLKTIEIADDLKNEFDLELKGCYMMCREASTLEHEIEIADKAKQFGLETIVYTQSELQQLEPGLGIKSIGAVYFPLDAHLHPIKWMKSMQQHLIASGVKIEYNKEVTGFDLHHGTIKSASCVEQKYNADQFIISTGAWLPEIVKKLNIHLLLQAGKGYSITYENVAINLSRPAILVDDRVALTPLRQHLRIGGTMELSGINHTIKMNRANAIVNAANKNFENLNLSMPAEKEVWCGLRPVTPDGLPFIGKLSKYNNLILAGGHAMLGVSLAAGTGKIVSNMVEEKTQEIEIGGFNPER